MLQLPPERVPVQRLWRTCSFPRQNRELAAAACTLVTVFQVDVCTAQRRAA
jgi:hypothetical protein